MSVKILDCTLRDGGYVNNWNFGFCNIKSIIHCLADANIDFIECGFLKNETQNINSSIFPSSLELNNIISKNEKYALMINYGEFPISKIPESDSIIYRIAFKKEDLNEALDFCQQIKNKNNKIFINPMYTNTYKINELLELINRVNKIKPYAFTIVDSAGAMKESDVLSTYYILDKNLDKDIAICFHSHNNLKLSFANAQALLKASSERDLIIDSTIFGIGRAAGNLCTEVISQHINDYYQGRYNLIPILKVLNEQINPIFDKTPWGYSVPYHLAAINSCHPNYAKYLDDNNISVERINEVLKLIPEEKKYKYDEKLVKNFITF